MSTLATSTPAPPRNRPPEKGRSRRWRNVAIVACICAAAIAAGAFYGIRFSRALNGGKKSSIPTARVQRGDITLSVFARGEIRGGNPEMLTAPLTGGTDMHITFLRKSGEEVKAGDVVVEFDKTEQEYKLKEAEADLAEANQHILQATAQMKADEEEDRYALLKAQTDVTVAELDVRKDPLLPSITARQNDLALQSARDHLAQLQQNLTNRKGTDEAGIVMQQAGRGKAESQALTARQNIEAMTLHAQRSGYVSLKQNTSGNFFFFGMTLPLYQVGDQVRPGMAVAEIPDLKNWELSANIGELDRGHLVVGEKVAITVIAVPDEKFSGHVKELGGTTGPPWDRHFECKMTLDNPSPALRPGMSAKINVTTDELHRVLWLPAQALFESDGRTFVYIRSGGNFTAKDVKLVRRNETRVVITGVSEGQEVALANPAEASNKKTSTSNPLESLPR